MSKNKKERKDPSYLREQGSKIAQKGTKRFLSFSLTKHIKAEGQSIEEWEEAGLLSKLWIRLKHLNGMLTQDALKDPGVKQYTKVDFPPNSKFTPPKHVTVATWVVAHVTPTSKEVVVGYIEDDIFHIVFLDKEHDFWPTELKNT